MPATSRTLQAKAPADVLLLPACSPPPYHHHLLLLLLLMPLQLSLLLFPPHPCLRLRLRLPLRLLDNRL